MAAARVTRRQIEAAKPRVRCAECRHFKRDTEGISRSIITGEYFMGICTLGLMPDSPIKQFADHPRHCDRYRMK